MPRLRRASLALPAAAASALLALACSCSSAPTASGDATSGTPSGTASTAAPSTSDGVTTSSPGTSAPAAAADRTITISVQGKKVTPAPSRIEMRSGQTLRLVVTSDHDDELHAHGFDVERELTAGQATTVDLTGAAPGLYEVETHHPELRLLQVVVRP